MTAIKCERRIYDNNINTHSHEYAQLILPLHGSMHIETDYRELTLNDDKIFFLPPECTHKFSVNDNNEFLVLDVSESMINKPDMCKLNGGCEFLFDEKWKALRFLLLNEAKNANSSSAINNLFLYCYDLISNKSLPASIQYIKNHFCEEINLKTLAEIEHYNPTYYTEWFKNNMNMSPTEYIQHLRLKKAKELLLNTDYTILQIAQIVGYNHNSSLTRLFKDLENISPLQFKRKNLNIR
ncbi:MAG: helix-turn-helix transcriptional regulator [Clostridium butyricum]|nr:helix-turn-helix transcriptional regulator [Clostridium butyricum]